MIRFLLRFIGMICLAGGFILLIYDGTKSIAGNMIFLTDVRTLWELIGDAGRKVLPSRGYQDSRVDDIVSAAGVSHGTFYRYFESKDQFFQVLAEGAALRAVELVERLDLGAPDDELRAWVVDWMHAYRDDGGIISVWQEMHTNMGLGRFSRAVAASMFAGI